MYPVTLQIDGRTVASIEDILAVNILLANDTFFAATEGLEGITFVQVHGSAAPNLSIFTLTTTEDSHCNCHQVIALVVEQHTGIAGLRCINCFKTFTIKFRNLFSWFTLFYYFCLQLG